jgi:hypothetical protein
LGCGHGNLDWEDVFPIIVEKMETLNDVDVRVYAPSQSAVTELEHEGSSDFRLTKERALLFRAVGEYEGYFDHNITKLCLQKIVYFFNVLGYNFNVSFVKSDQGPYSEELSDVFKRLEAKNILQGYSDHSSSIASNYFTASSEFIEKLSSSEKIDGDINRISKLIEGYESPYGMELLASVHWIVDNCEGVTEDEISECVHGWSDRKKEMFDKAVIKQAYERLLNDGFISVH